MHTVVGIAHVKAITALHRPTIFAVIFAVSHQSGRCSDCPCTLMEPVLPPLTVVGAVLQICVRTQTVALEELVACFATYAGVGSPLRIRRRAYRPLGSMQVGCFTV